MGSGDGMKELIEKLAAKIDDLKTSLDKLAPLARVAEQLATLPSKVVALQSSAFENQEQVRALNLAIPRAENAQREGRAHAEENGNTTGEGSINRARQGPVPALENNRQPPNDRFRQLPPEQPTKLSPRTLHGICGGGRSHMGQALRGAAGRVRAPPSPAPVPPPRPPPPRALPAAASGGARQDGIGVSQDNVTPPPKDAPGLLKERDPSYDEMLKHMVGRITTKPGGKPKRGEAFVEDRYNRPLPKLYQGKSSSQPGQWIWLRLLHRAPAFLQVRGRNKLGSKFFGTYKVAARVGEVAYKLELPAVQHGKVMVEPEKEPIVPDVANKEQEEQPLVLENDVPIQEDIRDDDVPVQKNIRRSQRVRRSAIPDD
ncbi:hypothetical protein GUJ93_ZPchr0005g16354 [Zizania palustris]|uniref:Tf2-1-like SH3-like domain-containing protein n=1 Tax=Zizania palustris TaxID=103762 RepID=A0A8J5S3F8_ZIZPA|nr:hypothetical protein GUJ93_ZPchr0005g16354 [Zizania palustris]